MKQIIRLTESDLHRIVKESVKNILKEFDGGANTTFGVNADGSADSSFGIAYPAKGLVDDDDPTYGREDIAMNKSEKPVGHKG